MTVKEIERIGSPEISRGDARRAFLAYRNSVLAEHDAARRREHEILMRGYSAIARGKQVIDLVKAMRDAGLQDGTFLPKLAIVRADAAFCLLQMRDDGGATFDWQEWRTRGHGVSLPADTFSRYVESWQGAGATRPRAWSPRARALTPMIPPHLRPAGSLQHYHILWDAVWTREPPKDPLLLRHLGGPLYAIVAAWDLTPLEQAVMRGRLT